MRERLRYRLSTLILFIDILVTLLCLYAASDVRLRINLGQEITWREAQLPWLLYVAVAVLWAVAFLLLRPHRSLINGGLIESIGRLAATVSLASLTFAGLLYLSFRDVSRLQFLYFAGLNLSALIIVHIVVRSYMGARSQRLTRRRVLVIGDPTSAERFAEAFATPQWSGLEVVGYTSDSVDAPSRVLRMGAINDTPQIVADERIDEVIFAMPPQQHERITRLSLALIQQPVMVHMIPGVLDLTFARTPVEMAGGIPLISLRESALTESQRILKRLFDLLASAALLIVLSPLMLLIALMIKLESPGSVFFTQERIGEHGRRFRMIKFRSMYQDAERRWAEVARRDASGNLMHKVVGDPRVTPVGRKLRRSSLDELPQLINVLLGQMSLVGPRPEIPVVAAEYDPWQWQRFRVPPGITGWWQVNGRSDKPMHLHTEDDLYYIQNYSFWLDLRILLKTVIVVLQGHGAY
jgi:exopolysaccharide biosynthesis polyprenyl glycosylphosphotransferase